ncbi:hypothetical protein B0H14DRAFT_3424786 [Mycena olivaceomarginata]|nr:hypothetical protein B0H14DRAFT_3424786 [Mycena olivaceomarginata]
MSVIIDDAPFIPADWIGVGKDYSGDLPSEEVDSDTDSISEAQQLQDLIDRAEDETIIRTRSQAKELLNLTSAALALSADDMMKIHSLAEKEEEILDELVAQEHDTRIRNCNDY